MSEGEMGFALVALGAAVGVYAFTQHKGTTTPTPPPTPVGTCAGGCPPGSYCGVDGNCYTGDISCQTTPSVGPRPIDDGQLITYDGAGGRVWVTVGGRKREIVMVATPGDVFAACGYRFDKIRFYPREWVIGMPEDCPVKGRPCPPVL